MAKNVQEIAKLLGADVVGKVPDSGGGAFGAARLALALRDRLSPSRGQRPGRPTVADWTARPKIPMSRQTYERLQRLAQNASTPERKISPMQLAAQLLEEAVARFGK